MLLIHALLLTEHISERRRARISDMLMRDFQQMYVFLSIGFSREIKQRIESRLFAAKIRKIYNFVKHGERI